MNQVIFFIVTNSIYSIAVTAFPSVRKQIPVLFQVRVWLPFHGFVKDIDDVVEKVEAIQLARDNLPLLFFVSFLSFYLHI